MTMPNKNSIESEIRDILDCWCAYTKLYDGKDYNLKTEEYDDCSCVKRLPELKNLIQREVKKGRVEELKKLWNKTQPDIMPLGTPPSDLNGQVILDRLEELEG